MYMNGIKNYLFLVILVASSSVLYTMEDPQVTLETFSFNKSTGNEKLRRKKRKKNYTLYHELLKEAGKSTFLTKKLKRELKQQCFTRIYNRMHADNKALVDAQNRLEELKKQQQEMQSFPEVEEFIQWHEQMQAEWTQNKNRQQDLTNF